MVRYLTQVILERDGLGEALHVADGRLGPAHAARRLKLVYPQAVDAGGADDVEIALGVYVRRVLRRWWIVVAAIVVAIAIALAGSSSGHTTLPRADADQPRDAVHGDGRRRDHERVLHVARRSRRR